MKPALRFVFAIIGALVALKFAHDGIHWLAALLGALAGLAISEAVHLRQAIATLRAEIMGLRALLERQAERSDAARTQPPAPVVIPPRPVATAPAQAPSLAQARAPAPARAIDPQQGTHASMPETPHGTAPAMDAPLGDRLVALVRDYFTGGNALVRSGVIVLLFGVGFLLRYLAEHSHIPIELRLSGVAALAIALLVLGWRLRIRRAGYALALQGGAVGILYLTVFAALRLYAVLPPAAAFALLVAVSVLSATLAVLQDSLAVALLSVTGGFLAPFLASTGHGNHVALFSYFAVLNGVILGIAWFRSWRLLNVAGFGFTFVLGTIWGVLQYRAQDFASTEPFLIGFFLLYVAVAVLYSTRQAPVLHGYLDGTIIFGTPIAAFGLQAGMLHDQRLALAYSALGVSALYTLLAWALHRRKGDQQRLLVEAFMALGVAFLTLAVPLALDGRWSAASWALEGTALIWTGCRQQRRLPRAFGALLQLAAGGALASTIASGGAVPSGTYIAALMVGVASLYAVRILHAHREQLADYEPPITALLFLWGLAWWYAGAFSELSQRLSAEHLLPASLAFVAASAVIGGFMASRDRMRIALLPTFGLLGAMLPFGVWAAISVPHPFAQGGWIAWPLAFASLYFVLRQHDAAFTAPVMDTLHAVSLWSVTALASWEFSWAIGQLAGKGGAWSAVAWGMVPVCVLALLPLSVSKVRWPFQAHRNGYTLFAAVGLSIYLALWSLYANASIPSPAAPLPYLPLFNPLDLVQALVLIVLVRTWWWLQREAPSVSAAIDSRAAFAAIGLVAFAWLNAMLLRTLHLWFDIPYQLGALLESTIVQSALSLLWATTALATMLVATRIRARALWLTGAALLIVVVAKLFLVDLSSIGTIARIVSFIGVGLLMLLVGYYSPLPPAARESR